MVSATYFTLLAAASASALAYPEVLNKRVPLTCTTLEDRNSRTPDIIACINELRGLGSEVCLTDPNAAEYPAIFCSIGTAQVSGESVDGPIQSAPCEEIGTAVQEIYDACFDADNAQGVNSPASNENLRVTLITPP